jgi:hypothetical protein
MTAITELYNLLESQGKIFGNIAYDADFINLLEKAKIEYESIILSKVPDDFMEIG